VSFFKNGLGGTFGCGQGLKGTWNREIEVTEYWPGEVRVFLLALTVRLQTWRGI